jgi:hypothetical protein
LTSNAWLRAVLALAAAAALVVVLGLFSTGVRVACLAVIVAATLVAAPSRHDAGGGWWWLLAAGACGSIAGALLAQVADTPGGWVALLSGLDVMIAAAVGFPLEE